jgi:hypothetical protein
MHYTLRIYQNTEARNGLSREDSLMHGGGGGEED